MRQTGKLYIVSTPIGNLEDITLRALKVLKESDLIACEDTRRARILTDRYGIGTPLTSFHAYTKTGKREWVISKLMDGKRIALISDAGTPGISDPGSALIKDAIDKGIEIEAIPGPVALITALVLSGKPTNKFVFEGFLSNKPSQRRKRLESLKTEERTVVLYESCHRIQKLLRDIQDVMGDREVVVARELTKKFEEVLRGRASSLIEHFNRTRPRGEFIVII